MEREPNLGENQGGGEALEKEANQQQQQQQEVIEVEDISDMEDQMSVTSRPKPIRRFLSTKGIQKGSQTAMRKPGRFRAVKRNSHVPSSVMDRAEQLRANLDAKYPSFAKLMRHSYVVHGFLLAFPWDFCREYMPQHGDVVVLENEAGQVFDAKFLGSKMGLSGGWRGFCVSNKLREGDAAVFHMIGATKFKVYIVRATTSGVAETPKHSLSRKKGKKREGGEVRENKYARQYEKSRGQKGKDSENDARKCGRATAFVGFQDFNIVINGRNVDINKPDVLFKYYQLCKAQNSFLHSGFLEPISPESAVSIISDTVRIADGIRSSGIFTPKNTFAVWDKALEGFEKLGLEVGFLRARVHKLANLAEQAEDSPPAKKLKEARVEYNLIAEEVEATTFEWYLKSEELNALDARLQKAKQEGKQLYCEMESLNGKIKEVESRFLKEARSPW